MFSVSGVYKGGAIGPWPPPLVRKILSDRASGRYFSRKQKRIFIFLCQQLLYIRNSNFKTIWNVDILRI